VTIRLRWSVTARFAASRVLSGNQIHGTGFISYSFIDYDANLETAQLCTFYARMVISRNPHLS
jgi:hypothetical protein